MIYSLIYLIASHPDIMFVIYLCACFQAKPKESHLTTVKRIMRYLIGTPLIDLWYPKGTNCSLVSYYSSNFTDYKLE